jgi:flagellar biosynthetic protein FlhB
MMSQVGTADVILVNPTHLAIALRYQPGKGAPRVVAKGAGVVAMKIRELARENRVPIVEDKPLARSIYQVCELEEEIPAELYMAVAQILAFVMAAGRPGRKAGVRKPTHRMPVPEVPTRAELKARRAKEIRSARR